jgi:uncharacterized MnhB-related membrane protein
MTEAVSIRLPLTTTGAMTLTFLSTEQVSFTEAYGYWVLDATLGTLLIIALLLFTMRRKKKQSRKRRRHR